MNKKHSQAHLLLVAVQMHVSVQKNVTAPAVMSSHLLQKLHYKMYGLLNSMAMLWKELFWNDLSSIITLHNNIWTTEYFHSYDFFKKIHACTLEQNLKQSIATNQNCHNFTFLTIVLNNLDTHALCVCPITDHRQNHNTTRTSKTFMSPHQTNFDSCDM